MLISDNDSLLKLCTIKNGENDVYTFIFGLYICIYERKQYLHAIHLVIYYYILFLYYIHYVTFICILVLIFFYFTLNTKLIYFGCFFRSDVDNQYFCWIGVTSPKAFLLPVSATRTIRLYAAVAAQGCYKTMSKLNVLARPYPPAQHAFLTQIITSSSLLVVKDPMSEVIN